MLAYLLYFAGLVLFVSFIATLVGSFFYDLTQVRRSRDYQRHPNARRYRQRPWVTVLVSSRNSEHDIEACLDSIRTGSYRKVKIVVVDRASEDATKRLVRAYGKKYPRLQIRLIAQRKVRRFGDSMSAVDPLCIKDGLVLLFRASDRLEKQTIALAVRELQAADLSAVQLAVKYAPARTIASLLGEYYRVLSDRQNKVASQYGKLRAGLQAGMLCNDQVAIKLLRGGEVPAHFAAHALYYESAATFRVMLTSYCRGLHKRYNADLSLRYYDARTQLRETGFLVMGIVQTVVQLILPVLCAYCLYVAVGLHQSTLFVVVVLYIAFMLLHAIWNDTTTNIRNKAIQTLGIPITYSYIFFALLVTSGTALHVAIAGARHSYT